MGEIFAANPILTKCAIVGCGLPLLILFRSIAAKNADAAKWSLYAGYGIALISCFVVLSAIDAHEAEKARKQQRDLDAAVEAINRRTERGDKLPGVISFSTSEASR